MEKEPLQWHPAFCSSLRIELGGEPLEFLNEFNLTRKPLQIDILVIKKTSSRIVQKKIGKIFRKHNIVEIKSPEDYLSINDFYKILGYACIYQSNTKRILEIRPDEITITFVINKYPRRLDQWLKRIHRIGIIRIEPGIYYLQGTLFPTQILVIHELSKEENIWLSRLRPGLDITQDLNVLAEEYKNRKMDPLYSTSMDVILRANPITNKEGNSMCQALNDLVDEWYGDRLKKEVAEETAKAVAREIDREVDKAITKTFISLVCTKLKRGKPEIEIANDLETELDFVKQICSVISEFSGDYTNDDVYEKWNAMYSVG